MVRLAHPCKEYAYPICHDEIKIFFLKNNVIGHPTTILRKKYFIDNNLHYDSKYPYCEDYELWTRAVRHFKVANIPEFLFYHRKHESQISTKFRSIQKRTDFKIKLNQISYVVGKLTSEEKMLYRDIFQKNIKIEFKLVENIIKRLYLLNNKVKYYNQNKLEKFIYESTTSTN